MRFNEKKRSYSAGARLTHEGGQGFDRGPLRDLLVLSLWPNSLSNTFYENDVRRLERFLEYARSLPPEHLAKAAVYVAESGMVRLAPAMMIGELYLRYLADELNASYERGKSLLRRTAIRVWRRPDMILDTFAYVNWRVWSDPAFVAYRRSTRRAGRQSFMIKRVLKNAVTDALAEFDTYKLIKWQKQNYEWSLGRVIRACGFPKTATDPEVRATLNAIMRGEAKLPAQKQYRRILDEGSWGQIVEHWHEFPPFMIFRNARRLFNLAPDKEQLRRLLSEVTGERLFRNGVLLKDIANAMLSWRSDYNTVLLDWAWNIVADLATHDVREQAEGKRAIVFLDQSGSMEGEPRFVSGLIGSAISWALDTPLVAFSTDCRIYRPEGRSLRDYFEWIDGNFMSAGTYTAHAIRTTADEARKYGERYDLALVITDEQAHDDVWDAIRETRDVFGFFVIYNLVGYEPAVIPPHVENAVEVAGLAAQMLKYAVRVSTPDLVSQVLRVEL